MDQFLLHALESAVRTSKFAKGTAGLEFDETCMSGFEETTNEFNFGGHTFRIRYLDERFGNDILLRWTTEKVNKYAGLLLGCYGTYLCRASYAGLLL
jgi:hypothetical protein